MKWFKHMSDTIDGPFMQDLMNHYGHAGYVAWFGLLEYIANENGSELTGKASVDPRTLKRKLRIAIPKLKEIYEFCQRKPEENSEKTQRKVRVFLDFSLENWQFDVPKLLELRDNYTKDLQVSGKKPSIEEELRAKSKNKEEETSPIPPSKKGDRKRMQIPQDLLLTDELRQIAKDAGLNGNIERAFEEFKSYWQGEGKPKANWNQTWRNRCIQLVGRLNTDLFPEKKLLPAPDRLFWKSMEGLDDKEKRLRLEQKGYTDEQIKSYGY